MTEIIEKEELAAGRVGRVTCFGTDESRALDVAGEAAQIEADKRGRTICVVNSQREVVGKAFPAPKTKAFSFVGLMGDKAVDYKDIFGHEDFVGDPNKKVA